MTDEPARRDTRDKILVAAATMIGEDPTARLSVRAVAARAGVSTGSLRHFFPTQRELLETVIAGMYEIEIPDDAIHDTERTPADRLLGALRQMLAAIGTGEQAREHWRATYSTYLTSAPTADDTSTYLALERLGLHHIERWLRVLIDEGAIPGGNVERRARFLGTLVNGLFVERVLPTDAMHLQHETETLRLAVEAVTGSLAGVTPPA